MSDGELPYFCRLKRFTNVQQEFIVGRQVTILNENALWNLTTDVNFLKEELDKLQRSYLDAVFTELKSVSHFYLLFVDIALNQFVDHSDHIDR